MVRGTLMCVCALALSASGAFLGMPLDIAESVKAYGAWGDGIHDDTRAIQRALDSNRTEDIDYNGRPKTLFFPAGTYLVSDTLEWRGYALTLQGQGTGASTIKLANNCTRFSQAQSPRPVIRSPSGNMSFRQNVHDLTINTGTGNPGAIGLDYISSNSGTVRDVEIISGDGSGVCGLDMTRAWPGPLLIKNLRVSGFDYGIMVAHSEYGPTFEDITLENQRLAGLLNDGNVCAIRNLHSTSSAPAIINPVSYGFVILVDAVLGGGRASVSAIEDSGLVYVRNVSAVGSSYRSALARQGAIVGGMSIPEYVSGTIQKLWDTSPNRPLNLPVTDAPEYHNNDTTTWGRFVDRWYGDTGLLQDLLNSGKSTIYVPAGVHFSHAPAYFTVPPTVKRIIGFHGVINHNLGPAALIFRVDQASSDPLIIERFGYGVGVEHRAARTVALKHGGYYYAAQQGAGDVFFDDVQADSLVFHPGQHVWMRQINAEGPELHVVNNGADLWVLGVKTEGKGTVVSTRNRGRTEVLGTLLYPCESFTSLDGPAFILDNASGSFMYRVSSYVSNGNYPVQVRETRGTVTREWRPSSNGAMVCPLFAGFDSSAMSVVPVVAPARRHQVTQSARLLIGAELALRPDGTIVYDIRGRRMSVVAPVASAACVLVTNRGDVP